jgi:hypothetical protein
VLPSSPQLLIRPQPKIVSAAADPFALDGTPQGFFSAGTASGALPGISTTHGNVIIYVGGITNGGPVTSITSTSSLTFSRRTQQAGGTSAELWSAKSAAALSNEVITVNTTGSSYFVFAAAAFSGSHFASPFDSNGAIPATSAAAISFTTSNANDILIGAALSNNSGAGSGYTQLYDANLMLFEYKIVTTTQSGLTMTNGGASAIGPSVGDAIIQGP